MQVHSCLNNENSLEEGVLQMTTVKISGMKCQHCVNSTRQALEALAGVSNVSIDLDKGEASFEGDVSVETVKEAVAKIGFEVVD